MPQTALMGPDGKQARDMQGTNLTMEEMLRRNGIVAMGNNVSMLGPQADPAAQANGAVTPPNAGGTASPSPAVMAAMQQRSGMNGGSAVGGPATAAADPSADPATEATMQQLADNNTDPSSVQGLEAAGLVAAGTAAAYLAYRAAKGLGGGDAATMGGTAAPVAGDMKPMTALSGIPEGEYTEVQPMKRVGESTRKAMSGRSAANAIEGRGQQKSLPAPQKRLPNNGRTATAQAMSQRAARGGPTDVAPIAGHAPVRAVNEAPEAGLARTLGIDSKLLQMLRANPGIARTLSRVP